jgi:hypothetical protein
MASTEPTGSPASRMRAAIDRGETGDKVDHPDPAAAPLGTDDEAAGCTSDPAAVEASTRRQRGIHIDRLADIEREREQRTAPLWPYAAIGAAALAAAAFLIGSLN